MNPTNDGVTKYGARVSLLSSDRIIVKQTVKSGAAKKGEYVIDSDKEEIVDISKDSDIADAIRRALAGQLAP